MCLILRHIFFALEIQKSSRICGNFFDYAAVAVTRMVRTKTRITKMMDVISVRRESKRSLVMVLDLPKKLSLALPVMVPESPPPSLVDCNDTIIEMAIAKRQSTIPRIQVQTVAAFAARVMIVFIVNLRIVHVPAPDAGSLRRRMQRFFIYLYILSYSVRNCNRFFHFF